jgi:hypothetical protein
LTVASAKTAVDTQARPLTQCSWRRLWRTSSLAWWSSTTTGACRVRVYALCVRQGLACSGRRHARSHCTRRARCAALVVHACSSAHSTAQKLYNWNTLNQKARARAPRLLSASPALKR